MVNLLLSTLKKQKKNEEVYLKCRLRLHFQFYISDTERGLGSLARALPLTHVLAHSLKTVFISTVKS